MASTLIAQSVFVKAPVAGRGVGGIAGCRRPAVAVVGGLGSRLKTGGKCVAREGGFGSGMLMGESLWRQPLGVGVRSEARTKCAVGVYVYNGVSTETVRWCVAAACAVLLLKRDAGAKKQFWAGILALEAPRDWVYWAKSEYGLWVACIGLALKLFYNIPAELDYPLAVYLFIVCAPAQAMAQRGTVGAAVLSTALALFVAFQYFSNSVRLSDAFKGEHLVNTILVSFVALACIGFFGMSVL
ncbi:hypothetical protein KC19_2G104300 [Ceratodon purpureus]|uniref:Uncharacterized protein n=1 Tax=Ceratodon purpureus TaxID=3225 RepID=A0A8T0IVA8_CERPU|nr:hypothetical protein KC19_2G104300 [Ceratodon purpureus]